MIAAKVTIITRTKNRRVLLRRALRSVLEQTYTDWAHVIVNDGGSREDVDALVEAHAARYAGRVQVIHNETSLGMEAASNLGLRSSSGRYAVIHDDDDAWAPEFLAETVARLESKAHPRIRGVVTHSLCVRETIEGDQVIELGREPHNAWLRQVTLFRMAAENCYPPISFLYERAVHDEIGYYREDLPVLGDWEFNLRFVSRWDVDLVARPLAYYHHRVALLDGEYANTVIGGDHKHKLFDAMIRNDFLRKDLEREQLGMGLVVNQAKGLLELSRLVEQIAGNLPQRGLLQSVKDGLWNAGKRAGLIRG